MKTSPTRKKDLPKKADEALAREQNKVFLMREPHVEYPELWMEVYVAGDHIEERAFANMFVRSYCTRADSPDTADLVVFTGGCDVNPALYNEDVHRSVHFDDNRDRNDMHLFEHCLDNGIPMLGVCRGMQFGHVMLGGKLYQDVSGHYGDHAMWDIERGYMIDKISSVHHQVCMPGNPGMKVLADHQLFAERWLNSTDKIEKVEQDIEALWYEDACFLGVQGHPEYRGYSRFTKWTLDRINDFIIENPRVELQGGVRRVKEEYRMKSDMASIFEALA
jgi:gamma-glutamyl-gamma-aminobutyrate hydrolase PuuD